MPYVDRVERTEKETYLPHGENATAEGDSTGLIILVAADDLDVAELVALEGVDFAHLGSTGNDLEHIDFGGVGLGVALEDDLEDLLLGHAHLDAIVEHHGGVGNLGGDHLQVLGPDAAIPVDVGAVEAREGVDGHRHGVIETLVAALAIPEELAVGDILLDRAPFAERIDGIVSQGEHRHGVGIDFHVLHLILGTGIGQHTHRLGTRTNLLSINGKRSKEQNSYKDIFLHNLPIISKIRIF